MGKLNFTKLTKMKTKPAIQSRNGVMPSAIAIVVCTFGIIPETSYGQAAEIFTPGKTSQVKTVSEVSDEELEAAPVDSQPSRFAGEDIEPYIRARAAVFSMRNRTLDPFCFHQDPNVKPVAPTIASNIPSVNANRPPTPLSEIVRQIPVTTIMPSEKKFLVGIRTFSEGDEFPLVFRGKSLQVKIMEVSSRQIVFKNVATDELGALKPDVLPPGMIAGGKKSRPAGMISDKDDAPLDLGSGGSFNSDN